MTTRPQLQILSHILVRLRAGARSFYYLTNIKFRSLIKDVRSPVVSLRESMMVLDLPSMLITDDDRAFRETLGGLFEERGFHTMLAEDGQAALEIVEREQVHLVLLDMNMPRLTGLETIRRVKQVYSVVPCILLSAEMDEALAEAARQAEAFSAHAKPISLPEITQTVSLAMRLAYDYDWPAA